MPTLREINGLVTKISKKIIFLIINTGVTKK